MAGRRHDRLRVRGALLTRLLTAAEGEAPLTALYHRFAGRSTASTRSTRTRRTRSSTTGSSGDAKRVALVLYRMCQDDLHLRDYSLRDASIVVRELVARRPGLPHLRRAAAPPSADAIVPRGDVRAGAPVAPDVPAPLIDPSKRTATTG